MGGAIFVLEAFSDNSPPIPLQAGFYFGHCEVEVGLVSTRHKSNASLETGWRQCGGGKPHNRAHFLTHTYQTYRTLCDLASGFG